VADEFRLDGGHVPLDAQRRSLGERRLGEFIQHHGMVNAELLALTMSINTAAQVGYCDEVLHAIRTDAMDLVQAANRMAKFARELTDHWKAQRGEHTVSERGEADA
jgi:alcohol dehydrogenase class IV